MTIDESAYVYIECYFSIYPPYRGSWPRASPYNLVPASMPHRVLYAYISNACTLTRLWLVLLSQSCCCSFPQRSFAFHGFCYNDLHFFNFYYPPILFPYFSIICFSPILVWWYIFFYNSKNGTKIEHYLKQWRGYLFIICLARYPHIQILWRNSLAS